MKKNTQDKITRLLISTLMSSELNNKELLECCQSLKNGDPFFQKLGYQLENFITTTMQISSENDVTSEIKEIHRYITRKGISRSKLLNIINTVSKGLSDYLQSQNLSSTRHMLEIIKEQTSVNQWVKFQQALMDYNHTNSDNENDAQIRQIYLQLRKKRMTIDQIIVFIENISPSLANYIKSQKPASIREALYIAKENMNNNGWDYFTHSILDDDYLTHILNRGE